MPELRYIIIENVPAHAQTINEVIAEHFNHSKKQLTPVLPEFISAFEFIDQNKSYIDVAFVDIEIKQSGINTGLDLIKFFNSNTKIYIYSSKYQNHNLSNYIKGGVEFIRKGRLETKSSIISKLKTLINSKLLNKELSFNVIGHNENEIIINEDDIIAYTSMNYFFKKATCKVNSTKAQEILKSSGLYKDTRSKNKNTYSENNVLFCKSMDNSNNIYITVSQSKTIVQLKSELGADDAQENEKFRFEKSIIKSKIHNLNCDDCILFFNSQTIQIRYTI